MPRLHAADAELLLPLLLLLLPLLLPLLLMLPLSLLPRAAQGSTKCDAMS